MKSKIVNSIDEQIWRSFVEEQSNANIFHTPEIFSVFQRVMGYQPQVYAALNQDGNILAMVTPVLVSLRRGILQRLLTRAIAYGGAVYTPDQSGSNALQDVLQACDQELGGKSLYTEFRNLSDGNLIQATLSKCGYDYEDHLNFLIDISGSPEQVMMNIGSRTRKNIRHGLRKGNVRIVLVNQETQLIDWYDLIKKSYQLAKVPLADFSLFKAAYEILVPKGMARFYLAVIDNNYAAATVELPYKDKIYGWYSGVDRNFASEYPGELLMWEILRWGAENGYKVYDFGGAGKPDEHSGVRDFKAKFGGQLVCYGRNIKVHSTFLLQLSKLGYGIYRKLFIGNQ